MAGKYAIEVHHGTKPSSASSNCGASSGSYPSSNSSTPRSYSPSIVDSTGSGKLPVHVHNLKRVGYDPSSPSPNYGGSYSRP